MGQQSIGPDPQFREILTITGRLDALADAAGDVAVLVEQLLGPDAADTTAEERVRSFGTIDAIVDHVVSFDSFDDLLDHELAINPDTASVRALAAELHELGALGVTPQAFCDQLRLVIAAQPGIDPMTVALDHITRLRLVLDRVRLAASLLERARQDIRRTNQFKAWSTLAPLSVADLE